VGLTRRVGRLEGQRAARGGTGATGGGVVFSDPGSGPPALPDTPGNDVVFVLPMKAPPPDPWAGANNTEHGREGGEPCDYRDA